KGKASPPGDPGLLGGLSFLGGDRIRVHDVEVLVPDSGGKSQSAIYVAPDPNSGDPGQVEICGNRLDVGNQQVGILVASASESRISDNIVRLATTFPGGVFRANRLVARQLGTFVARHVLVDSSAPAPTPAPASAPAPGGAPAPAGPAAPGDLAGAGVVAVGKPKSVSLANGVSLSITGASQIRRVITDFAKSASVTRLAGERSSGIAIARFVAASATEPHQATIGAASATFIGDAVRNARSMAQGIVVGGSRAPFVRIDGNLVQGAIEGIHVGVQARGTLSLTAGQVTISDNTVALVVPFFWARQRHAFYVGSVVSLTMTDNHARLARTGNQDATPVDAVRVWGSLGSWIEVRGLDLTGPFRIGVQIRDTGSGPVKGRSLHYLSDVLNADGSVAVDVPADFQHDRCLP
ncbi:MAG: hypothetical protein ABI131_05300, partial [Nostocoides sp.]